MSQDQLWNAGPVKFIWSKFDQRRRDQAKVADGRNRERMQRRRAAKLGMSLSEYQAYRAEKRARAAQPTTPREPLTKTCDICGQQFTTNHSSQVRCSDKCRRKANSRAVSAAIQKRYRKDPAFKDRVVAATQARRAEKLGLGGEYILLSYLLERDHWRCGICKEKIRQREHASIDHIVPLARGGTHSLANVQAAHRRCNYSKGSRGGGEQLRIVG